MSEHVKHNAVPTPPQVEMDMMALIKRMQQQLGFLEKKIDILIRQSSERPFKEKHFSKPFRPGGENRGFDQRKKPFFRARRDRG